MWFKNFTRLNISGKKVGIMTEAPKIYSFVPNGRRISVALRDMFSSPNSFFSPIYGNFNLREIDGDNGMYRPFTCDIPGDQKYNIIPSESDSRNVSRHVDSEIIRSEDGVIAITGSDAKMERHYKEHGIKGDDCNLVVVKRLPVNRVYHGEMSKDGHHLLDVDGDVEVFTEWPELYVHERLKLLAEIEKIPIHVYFEGSTKPDYVFEPSTGSKSPIRVNITQSYGHTESFLELNPRGTVFELLDTGERSKGLIVTHLAYASGPEIITTRQTESNFPLLVRYVDRGSGLDSRNILREKPEQGVNLWKHLRDDLGEEINRELVNELMHQKPEEISRERIEDEAYTRMQLMAEETYEDAAAKTKVFVASSRSNGHSNGHQSHYPFDAVEHGSEGIETSVPEKIPKSV